MSDLIRVHWKEPGLGGISKWFTAENVHEAQLLIGELQVDGKAVSVDRLTQDEIRKLRDED